jgi:hypothetical protein
VKKTEFSNKAALDAFIATGALDGRAVHLTVLHDDACRPGVCSCEPAFVVEELTEETYRVGQEAQRNWVKGRAQ